MSRSRRKHPIIGVSSGSEKHDKRLANRKFRKQSKLKLEDGPYKPREVSDNWTFVKDGKCYIGDTYPKGLRK